MENERNKEELLWTWNCEKSNQLAYDYGNDYRACAG